MWSICNLVNTAHCCIFPSLLFSVTIELWKIFAAVVLCGPFYALMNLVSANQHSVVHVFLLFFFLMGLHEMFIASSQDDVIEILFHRKKLRERWFAVAEILN